MAEVGSTEPIVERLRQLTARVESCFTEETTKEDGLNFNFPQILAREGLLDALLVLFEECNCKELMKKPIISSFVNKCKVNHCSLIYASKKCLKIFSSDYLDLCKFINTNLYKELKYVLT